MGPRDMVKMGRDERSAREVASRLNTCVHFSLFQNKVGECALCSTSTVTCVASYI